MGDDKIAHFRYCVMLGDIVILLRFMNRKLNVVMRIFVCLLLIAIVTLSHAQGIIVAGKVVDDESGKPVEFASVLMKEHGLWATTDEKGDFMIRHVPLGTVAITIQCLGYARKVVSVNVSGGMGKLKIKLKEDNLKLDEVEVVAKRKMDEPTTSYTIDRLTLDNQQILNINEISTLLPGGKTVNSTLMNDARIALRSSGSEKGNPSFGTAIEVDGMRVSNNGIMGETMAASTRNLSSSDIESVEVVTGIPSVEYGDLSNGVVRINTRRGKSPFIVEGKINQHTRQVVLNKGFEFGRNRGVLNASLEHARSFSDAASPHTAYQRNILSVRYTNTWMRRQMPLTLNIGVSGNVGGYTSEADPDNTLKSYAKVRDNVLRGNLELNWLLNKPWITNLSLKGTFSYQDKFSEDYSNASSASAQPYIHTREEGYFIAYDYDTNPSANIILGPTGYWYVRRFGDQKPVSYSVKLKVDWTRRFGRIVNKLLLGAEYSVYGNNGRGTYYEDMRYAPTWREYRYDELPWVNNLALYAENKVTIPVGRLSSFLLTVGLRDDVTLINGSDYGNVSSLSPRFNIQYTFWKHRKAFVRDLSIHAGWGKSVKLPSFQVLYPSPTYSDILSFTPGSTVDNRAYYAYYTYPSKAIYNANLKWMYTNQTDIGIEANIGGTKVAVSGFYHETKNPYMSVYRFTPFEYKMTSQSAIENSGVASADRRYEVNQETGVVTLYDASGKKEPMELAYTSHHTYNTNRLFTNGSPVKRYGLEWIVDFAQIKPIRTSLRLDGNYYYYKGVDYSLIAGGFSGVGSMTHASFPLVGYYIGSSSTSTGTVSSSTIANGHVSKEVNLNATLTTHIPKIRMIVSMRLEASLYNFSQPVSEKKNGTRGIVLENVKDYFGLPYSQDVRDKYVAVYPEYYSTWDNPNELIPFAEKFAWAKEHDQALYNQLARLVVKSNYAYIMNPESLSRYFSVNFSVTKEIGRHVSVSFYANNFFNNFGHVKSSQTGLKASLFGSGYIPRFYYGMSLRLKI